MSRRDKDVKNALTDCKYEVKRSITVQNPDQTARPVLIEVFGLFHIERDEQNDSRLGMNIQSSKQRSILSTH